MPTPTDCRYTYSPDTNRLYLHLMAWPFRSVHLPELSGKVKYAQFLHDASEVKIATAEEGTAGLTRQMIPKGAATLELPTIKPKIAIPVIEIFLK